MNTPPSASPKSGMPFYILSTVLFFIGIGGFGTASDGEVEMFGWTLEAKYACFIYFVLGGLFVWSTLEAKRRGRRFFRPAGPRSSSQEPGA